VLNLESATPRGFSPEDVVLVQMIAGYVAAALANARLFDAAQEASRLKSSILDTVSHEFRTPITSIVGFTELFQERVLGPVNDEQQEALDAIQRGARRLLKLVDDLLDLARIESGALDLELHPVEVTLCVQEAVNLVAPQFRQKNLDLRVDIDDNLAPIYADPMWLRRILINLLTNAVRFTDKGQVTVRAYETGPASDEDQANDLDGVRRRVVLEVEDTGVGVATADQHRIFEAFRRAPNAPASIAGGSGLGLAISRRVIEQMQGQLTLRSQPNSGSTFMIVLPLAELAREHQ
jgi:two-component system sensor histidine kinase EvgS